MKMNTNDYTKAAVGLLKQLIATPSVSRDEQAAADVLCAAMDGYGMKWQREGNNVWTVSPDFSNERPTLLLNAHIDTVKPVSTWTRDPFTPVLEGDRLYGLGANFNPPPSTSSIWPQPKKRYRARMALSGCYRYCQRLT